ncbi:hypothetical protein [Lysinibacillus sp. BSL11]
MEQDDKELQNLEGNQKSNEKNGDNDMAIIEKELRDMQKLQQKRTLTREQLRKALIKETIKDNYSAIERLSRT